MSLEYKDLEINIKDKGVFNQCHACKNWVEITQFQDDGSYFSPLLSSLDGSGRWLCSNCFELVDIITHPDWFSKAELIETIERLVKE